MQRMMRSEEIHFSTLDDVVEAAKAPGAHLSGVEVVKHSKLPKGVVMLVGPGKFGFYDQRSGTCRIQEEKALA